jgi:hypothetical protein
MMPGWLHLIASGALLTAIVCAVVIALDEIRNPQRMWIMNIVWPVSALFGTVLWLAFYLGFGKRAAADRTKGRRSTSKRKPFPIQVAEATSHCGSGCTLGDICAEWLAFSVPLTAVWLGWHSLFVEKIFAVWVLDFVFAYLFGIVFQYFTIAPMRNLSWVAGLCAAMKADTLSLAAWQIGMYGFMAIAYFKIFRDWLGIDLKVNSLEFWFAMQIAMLFGFATAYPVNWWLLRTGLKDAM